MDEQINVGPVAANDVADLAALFATDRSTRHCWCTAFCVSGRQFAAGWFGGGNRRRFAELATSSSYPMGVLASVGDVPVGWCACGPRSRYTAAINGRSRLLRDRPRDDDDRVWMIVCLFVAAAHRGRGVTHALVAAAVALARSEAAVAVESWPITSADPNAADRFLGREALFVSHGFECVERPSPQRRIMRLDLRPE